MTENEIKFVLNLECEEFFKKNYSKKYEICQGYMLTSKGISLRFRQSYGIKKINHYMTFKFNTGKRTIEIETKIDKRDFDEIWPNCLNKVYKTRYVLEDWEIDFFLNKDNSVYFSMAEIELPENVLEPNSIPKFISDNLLYRVPIEESSYSSKLLSDVRYAENIYKNLKNRKEKSYGCNLSAC